MNRNLYRILVLVPAALLDTAFGLDLAGRWLHLEGLWTAGARVAVVGIAAGLLVGVPVGIAGARAGGRRAGRFAALTLAGLALFALARWVRGDEAIPPEPVLVAAEGIAVVLALAGAWAGGFLDEWREEKPSGDGRGPAA